MADDLQMDSRLLSVHVCMSLQNTVMNESEYLVTLDSTFSYDKICIENQVLFSE